MKRAAVKCGAGTGKMESYRKNVLEERRSLEYEFGADEAV